MSSSSTLKHRIVKLSDFFLRKKQYSCMYGFVFANDNLLWCLIIPKFLLFLSLGLNLTIKAFCLIVSIEKNGGISS